MNERKFKQLDVLFGCESTARQGEQIELVDDSLIDEFPGHPYRLYTGKRQHDLLESIKELGVITPVTLRAEDSGRYTLLAGYNRRHCNQIAGNKQIPAVIKRGISNGEAKLIITHSNRQRGLDELLPSEKAFAFKMELEGLKETRRQQKKVAAIEQLEMAANADEQGVCDKVFNFEHLEKTRCTLAEHYGLKPTDVQRLIRLTHLCPELLELVDENKIQVYVAVPLSYLSMDMQLVVHRLITENRYKLDIEKTELLKAKFKEGVLTESLTARILSGKEIQSKPPTKVKPVSVKPATIKKYFVKGESTKEIQSTIAAALEFYFKAKVNAENQGGAAK